MCALNLYWRLDKKQVETKHGLWIFTLGGPPHSWQREPIYLLLYRAILLRVMYRVLQSTLVFATSCSGFGRPMTSILFNFVRLHEQLESFAAWLVGLIFWFGSLE